MLEGDAGQGAFIARALEGGAFRVAEGGLDRFPIDLGALAGHDVVVLSDIRASDLSPGQSGVLTVDLSKPGTYEFYCPVGNHREQGMEGTITVQ